jgi:hypothetical protein
MAANTEKDDSAVDHHDGGLRDADADADGAIQLAHDADDSKYSPWSWRMCRLYLVLSLSYLCGCLNGYDGSLMGGLNGMHSYQRYFNM